MSFREVNEDDILKEWYESRNEYLSCNLSDKDKLHRIEFDEICEQILKSIPEKNRLFVQKKLELLDDNLMDYIFYWNEKYYRNGFVDGAKVIMGCLEE